jgi:hypothetical protein
MGNTRKRIWRRMTQLIGGAAAIAAAVSWSPAWRLAAQKGTSATSATSGQPAPAPGSGPVRTVPAGTRLAGEAGKKGETYYWLESRTTRLTTKFGDATVVAERGTAGEIRARVHDAQGNETANFNVNANAVQYATTGTGSFQALNDSGEKPTLDWANRQAYSLWKDRASASRLSWQSGLMRPQGAARRDLDKEIVEIQTDWADGLSIKTTRKTNVKGTFVDKNTRNKRELGGEVFTGRLSKHGVDVGSGSYFTNDKVLVWNLPNVSEGYISAEHLKDFGGWPFTPDAAWLNLQTIAFYHFKALIDANGFVARNGGVCSPTQSAAAASRLLNFFYPTVSADEPGCDGLHWLDGSVFRFCCDVHDRCYERYGCTYHSWWLFWSSWSCTACNQAAVWCFATGGGTWEPGYGWLQPADDRSLPVKQGRT